MIEGKREIYNRLDEMAGKFMAFYRNKQYTAAKREYDAAVTIALRLDIEEEKKEELFGTRGERGTILKRGLFPEDLVMKVTYETCMKKGSDPEKGCYTCENYKKN